jgi:hypothetical protein
MNEQAQTGYLILFAILLALTGFSFEFWSSQPEPVQAQATNIARPLQVSNN